MTSVNVLHYDAFSPIPGKGNPAGVVLDADGLTDEQMQQIAARVGFNETTFVCRSERADAKLRYFTPGHEMDLCGHATMASLYALHTRNLLDKEEASIETRAGILPVELLRESDPSGEQDYLVMRMRQGRPEFVPFEGDEEALLASIGLTADDRDERYPIVYGSTGIWTLLLPIRDLEAFSRMKPRNAEFPGVLKQNPRASLHPFCSDTFDPSARMHARHFSSPYSGTIEDPVTGTATGVMGAYALTYLEPESRHTAFVVEQGLEMGRNGRAKVEAWRTDNGETEIKVSGRAVYVGELAIEIE
ncbi:isomerase [Saccharibacillus sp. O23]|uniref:PhzF family phenazine biosynthesis protein n=1 Tax=Saccharibacillus sp. O23 TaxID=2009338 RepID=UPI000B4E2943|nr:PhzF family phenazine biosynthesis isomerase [Saccharibacillus sp. O23]OWR27207.1 isomerase [Saccharibacillus sp. O23]